MEVMKPIQDRFRLLCVCPSKTKNPFIKIRNVIIAVLFILIIISYGVFSVGFIVKNLKTDLETSLQATMQMSISWALTYKMIASYFLRNRIAGVFEAYQNLYDKCNLFYFYSDIFCTCFDPPIFWWSGLDSSFGSIQTFLSEKRVVWCWIQFLDPVH